MNIQSIHIDIFLHVYIDSRLEAHVEGPWFSFCRNASFVRCAAALLFAGRKSCPRFENACAPAFMSRRNWFIAADDPPDTQSIFSDGAFFVDCQRHDKGPHCFSSASHNLSF